MGIKPEQVISKHTWYNPDKRFTPYTKKATQ